MIEHRRTVAVFGGEVVLAVSGHGADGLGPTSALLLAEALLQEIHDRLTPFDPGSELSLLNADPRPLVAASPIVRRLVASVRPAGELSGGLVDATLRGSDCGPAHQWHAVQADHAGGLAERPPGVRIDPCGLAKGLAADLVARRLRTHPSFCVDCLGDLRTGGAAGLRRPVVVAHPFGGAEPVATLGVHDGAVATSGTTRRAGHLLDPRTGAPADTGIVQATALAPTGLEAEIRAKAALLAGPDHAHEHLPHGGLIVTAAGDVRSVPGQDVGRATLFGDAHDRLLADAVAA